jgi:hypothetical protein
VVENERNHRPKKMAAPCWLIQLKIIRLSDNKMKNFVCTRLKHIRVDLGKICSIGKYGVRQTEDEDTKK